MNRWVARLIGLLTLAAGIVAGTVSGPGAVAAQAVPLTYGRFDVAITLRADGTMLVRERQQIRFAETFQQAFAEIPTAFTTAINAIQIYEGEEAYQAGGTEPGYFTSYQEGDLQVVEWGFTPTRAGDVRTFVLEYVVEGGLWVYPDAQVIEWRAVPAERSEVLVEQSTVTVTLPSLLAAEQLQYTADGPAYAAQVATTGPTTQVIFQASEALPEGIAFHVQVGLPPATVNATIQPWQEREDRANLAYTFPKLAVDLTFDPDGTLWVAEHHQLAVTAGSLDQGERTIPLTYIDQIDQISVQEGEQLFSERATTCDYCYQVSQQARRDNWVTYDRNQQEAVVDATRTGQVKITWQLPPLVRGETTTITLRYRVLGALQLLADGQKLNWTAVFPERAAPVEQATVTVHLPATVDPATAQITGGTVTRQPDGTVQVVAPRAVAAGQSWNLYLDFPVAAFSAPVPSWQHEYEAVLAEAAVAATRRARLQLGFGVGGLLVAVLGLLALYLLWYSRGRDLPIPALADYLPEPPSALPPAIVAYLLDEAPSTKGALASLFHLATLGLLAVRFDNVMACKRLYADDLQKAAAISSDGGMPVVIPDHLVTLFNALKPALPLGEEVTLPRLHGRFRQILPQVYAEMGTEATHFFDELPTVARQRWLGWGQLTVLLSLGGTVLLAIWYLGEIGWLAVLPALALFMIGIGLIVVSRWMPRRTQAGVAEAQRWRAFHTYLRNLKKYTGVEDAQRIIDRYFAYAVALDVETVVLKQAETMGGRLPPWSYTPTWQAPRRVDRHPAAGSSSTESAPTTSQPLPTGPAPTISEPPSLRGMSRQMGSALSNASSNLGNLLSQAAPTAPDTPWGLHGQGESTVTGGKPQSTLEVLGKILSESATGGGSGGYRSSGTSRSSWGSSSSRSSSRSSSSSRSASSGRSSSSRRSGGGGRRGFR